MDTRQRILEIARDLFAEQGYAGTSIAHIAGRLGTTKAALYYHFSSKAEILSALVEEPLAAYARLAESRAAPAEILAAVIDTTATYLNTAEALSSDPSARLVLRERAQELGADEINAAIVAALAGPRPSVKQRVRAHAAYAVAKHATLSFAGNGELSAREREEILAVAVRAMDAH
jgi:AcrR family transcriptional regulator